MCDDAQPASGASRFSSMQVMVEHL